MNPTALPPALDADAFDLVGAAGRVHVYADARGNGAPLLLVHSVNAAANARELRPVFEHCRGTRPVYALDLPGFGLSERSERAYTPRLMTDAVLAAAAEVSRRHGGARVDLLALSLGAEFAARAASESPAAFGRLALVSPTGLNGTTRREGPPGSTRAVPGLHSVLALPLWSGAPFRALTRPGVIRFFLEKTWGGRAIDEDLWRYDVQVTRAAQAKHAPLHFLAGGLFSADIHRVYASLALPVWMCHGTRGDFVDYRGKRFFEGRPNWRFDVFETGALPHFEQPAAFFARCDAFFTA